MKRYTSKQEYAAFYWDGDNIHSLSLQPKAVIVSTSIGTDVKPINPSLFHNVIIEVEE